MQNQAFPFCPCLNCTGAACHCGCQSTETSAAAPTPCACPGRCSCDAAEQGCLCA